MMKSVFVVLVLLVVFSWSHAEDPTPTYRPQTKQHPQTYQQPQTYYPRFGGYRPYLPTYFHPPSSPEEPLNFLDKLWERVDDITRGNKIAAEHLDALDARMSQLKKIVDDLELVVFPALVRADQDQNNDLDILDRQLDSLMSALDELENSTLWLEQQNEDNRDGLVDLQTRWAIEKDRDAEQDGAAASLGAAVTDFKSKLFVVLRNEFELFEDKVEVAAGKLDSTKTRETLRMCETGSVTLTSEDRKAEYVFQSDFADVPAVTYSITGFEADLDVRGEPLFYGYYGYPPKEPNAIGCVVHAYTTRTSVTFQSIDFSFGDTEKLSVDVNFQVCSIGPGAPRPTATFNIITPEPTTTTVEVTTTTEEITTTTEEVTTTTEEITTTEEVTTATEEVTTTTEEVTTTTEEITTTTEEVTTTTEEVTTTAEEVTTTTEEVTTTTEEVTTTAEELTTTTEEATTTAEGVTTTTEEATTTAEELTTTAEEVSTTTEEVMTTTEETATTQEQETTTTP